MDSSSIGGSWKGYNPPPAAAAASGVDAASETDGISVLPPEILSQVFTLLSRNDILSASLVSRSWNVQAIDNIKRKEMELLRSYSNFLADNLDGEKYPLEKSELLRLSEDNHILNCESLGEVRVFLLKIRDNIVSQLSKLDQYDFNKLRELTKNEKMPGLLKVIFDYVDVMKSLKEANLIYEPWWQSVALQKICKQLVELGELDKALDVARAIREGFLGDEMLADICRKFVEKGHFEKAIKIASLIKTSGLYCWISFGKICEGLTQANKVDRAVEVASNLESNRIRSHVFHRICMPLYSSKQFDKAIAIAGRIDEDDIRGIALQRISQELLSSGKLEESKRIAQTIPIIYLEEQARIDELIEVADSIPNTIIRDSLLRKII